MAYKDGNSPSSGSKVTLLVITLTGVIYAIRHISYVSEEADLNNWILMSCILVFYARLVISLFVFIKRKVGWPEGVSVGVLYGIMIVMFSIWGTQKGNPGLFCEIAGVVMFATGSLVNSLSDYQRYKWKERPGNKGHLYTRGLFRYATHINFFGDSIMFAGFALVTQNPMSFIPVIFIVLNFIVIQIPQLDDHLKNKYGNEFREYSLKTKRFIPFIY